MAVWECELYESTVLELSDFEIKYSRTIMKKMKARKLKGPTVMEDVRGRRKDELFGFLADEVKIIGDIESPVFPAKRSKKIKKQS